MFMKALRDKTRGSKRQISQARSLVAPVKGWWVGSPMAEAPTGTAFLLENVFPEFDFVRIRSGSSEFASGMAGIVRTLIPYTNGSIARLFAYCGNTIYDVTAGGTNPPFVVTGLSSTAQASYVQYSGTGPQTLIVANGSDPLQFYNGTSWSLAPAWTGLGPTQISFVWQYNHRIYGIAENSTDVYYTGVNAIGGPATIFPMGPLLKLGGKLIAGTVWTQLTANGEMYLWVVISSEGEIVLFTGSFPGDTTFEPWKQMGCYKVGRPLGMNCLNSVGADVTILTEDGIVPMSKVLTLDRIALNNFAATQYIAPAFKDAVQARVGQPGWQMTLFPPRYMAIVNMPHLAAPPQIQFISNARTGAWARYSGWDARCFAVHGLLEGKLYYGTSDGRVFEAETGGMDDDKAYTGTIFYSYSGIGSIDVAKLSLGTSGSANEQTVSSAASVARKHVSMVRARFQTNVLGITPSVTIKVDYDTEIPALPPPTGQIVAGTNWDQGKWDVDKWQGSVFHQTQNWVPVYAMASAIAPVIQATVKTTANPDLRLTATDVLFESGNIFG